MADRVPFPIDVSGGRGATTSRRASATMAESFNCIEILGEQMRGQIRQ